MRRLNCFFVILLFVSQLASAQTLAKRYVMVEHFTNTYCGICASKNPAFFTTINSYPKDVHHLAVHPSVPYPQCTLYKANTEDNQARASYYGINGTPRVALNGSLMPVSTPMLAADSLKKRVTQTSPLAVVVTESGTGMNRSVQIKLNVLGSIPTGDYRLYAVVAERLINLTTPNGEKMHHNVLRDIITPGTGSPVLLGSTGSSTTIDLSYTLNDSWNASEIYVLAFVQNNTTKEVLNSGTRFDPVITSVEGPQTRNLGFYPNPAGARNLLFADLPESENVRTLELYDPAGRRFSTPFQQFGSSLQISLPELPSGLYRLRVQGSEAVYTGKIVIAN